MDAVQAECIIGHLQNPEEQRVARLLYGMGMDLVAANSIFYDAGQNHIGEIDLIFTSEKTTWVIEVSKNADSAARTKKRQRFREWKGKERWAMVATEHKIPSDSDVHLVYVDLFERGDDTANTMDVRHEDKVTILYKVHIDRLEQELKKAKDDVRNALVDSVKRTESSETA